MSVCVVMPWGNWQAIRAKEEMLKLVLRPGKEVNWVPMGPHAAIHLATGVWVQISKTRGRKIKKIKLKTEWPEPALWVSMLQTI